MRAAAALSMKQEVKAMDDEDIIALYWRRDENALRATSEKYGRLCCSIAGNILSDREDVSECVNDAYYAVWNSIPEARPAHFQAYLAKITRNIALNRFRSLHAEKRRGCAAEIPIDELAECVSGGQSPEDEAEARRIEQLINRFLWSQEEYKRVIFVRRYWYMDSLQRLSDRTGFSQGKIKSILFRMRQKLREYLESEGVDI